ncbi:MAG TPA: CHASE2 domain-containing protein, partial [Candidatus Binatia bacterium]|nr:CHASE2 domain-containing protein [Candidatus Binatia bacterium]
MKERIWSKDWFAALAFTVLFGVAYLFFYDTFQGLERYTYDLGVRARQRPPSDRIAVVAIDDESIRNLGRWPWPRNLHAAMTDLLREGGAKVVGNTIFYFEAQEDPGLRYIREINQLVAQSPLAASPDADVHALMDALAAKLTEAQSTLSVDRLLAESMAKGPTRTVLGMLFHLAPGVPAGRPDQPLPDHVRRNALTHVVDRVGARGNGWLPIQTEADVLVPLPELGQAVAATGHMTETLDLDGAKRYEPLVLQHFDEYYPSLALMIAAQALNLKPDDIEVRLGEGIALGGLQIPTTSDMRMYTHFYTDRDGHSPFPIDSFFDVFTGKIPPSSYKDKIVLIGATAPGVGNVFPTPVKSTMYPVESLAHSVSSILQQDFFTRPGWAGAAEPGLYVLIALYLALVLPRLGPALGAGVTGGLAASLLITEVSLMAGSAAWLKLVSPVVLLVSGHLFMTIKRLRLTEILKASSESEGAESNRMLGLAFQGQGQLDMAFEKFRRVQPVDDKVLDLMYNLALDFERKRQFNKAESVYQH